MAWVEHLLYCTILVSVCTAIRSPQDQPNIIVFLSDDMGYGDLSSYGHPTQEFGPIDQMGREGMRFTNWHAAAVFCSPSRGSMLTGRYPARVGLYGVPQWPFTVFFSASSKGLPKKEITYPEALQKLGYATGMVGKWHLGLNTVNASDGSYLPQHQGFDYVGTFLPMSLIWQCDRSKKMVDSPDTSFCFYYYGDKMLEQPMTFHNVTTTMLLEAKAFIHAHQEEPFLFYYSFPNVHTSLYRSKPFENSSRRGLFGDNLNEMSWAVGEVLQLLRDLNLEKNTLAVFLSDHGPEREMCKEAGVSGTLRGWKGHTWEGGARVPAIAWWPGSIPADVTNHELISSMDLFNLAIELGGGTPPTDRVIDGRSIKDVLLHNGKSPHESIFHYCGRQIMAVTYKNYKVHYRTQEVMTREQLITHCGPTGIPDDKMAFHCMLCEGDCVTIHNPPLIFNMDEDPEENYPLDATKYEHILKEADRVVAAQNADMPIKVPLFSGAFCSTALVPCCNPPYCWCSNWDVQSQGDTCKAE